HLAVRTWAVRLEDGSDQGTSSDAQEAQAARVAEPELTSGSQRACPPALVDARLIQDLRRLSSPGLSRRCSTPSASQAITCAAEGGQASPNRKRTNRCWIFQLRIRATSRGRYTKELQ